jgi:hypothetical protein
MQRKLLFCYLHHAGVAFGLIVGEGRGRSVEEAQDVLFAICEAQEKIVRRCLRPPEG